MLQSNLGQATSFMLVAQNEHLEVVWMLLEAGADSFAIDGHLLRGCAQKLIEREGESVERNIKRTSDPSSRARVVRRRIYPKPCDCDVRSDVPQSNVGRNWPYMI